MYDINDVLSLPQIQSTAHSLICNDELSVYQISLGEQFLVLGRVLENIKYCTIIAEFYTISYNGVEFKCNTINLKHKLDKIDPEITEEQFFQRSCIDNYGGIGYNDVKLLRDVYEIISR